MKQYTYLLVEFFTIIICFIASFDKRIQFHKHFVSFILAAVIVAVPFIAWDVWFTATGVWWFDENYTIGCNIAGLPLEEWLFFICIPFACVFTYYVFEKFFAWSWASAFNNIIVFAGIIFLAVMALLHQDKIYTLVTACATVITLIFLHFIAKAEWITRATVTYILLTPGFFFVNGILTGTGIDSPIVNYNPAEFLGIRMLTIPVEDAVYGYSQFLLVIYFFKMFQQSKLRKL